MTAFSKEPKTGALSDTIELRVLPEKPLGYFFRLSNFKQDSSDQQRHSRRENRTIQNAMEQRKDKTCHSPVLTQ
jgi:hypothetical protein